MKENEESTGDPGEEWGDDPFADAPGARTEDEEEVDDETFAAQLLPQEKLSFEIVDAQDASWVVRKIVEARSRQERIKEWAAREQKAAKREEEFFLRRFGPGLEAWMQENSNGKKTVRLPDGNVGFRKKRISLHIEDRELLLDWCRRNLPDAVKVQEDVLKTPLNEHLRETGEVPPGCDLDAGGDEFYVR
jgi:phage host-nuclease inhibitor protein Gam